MSLNEIQIMGRADEKRFVKQLRLIEKHYDTFERKHSKKDILINNVETIKFLERAYLNYSTSTGVMENIEIRRVWEEHMDDYAKFHPNIHLTQ